jgi:hypothetical protein
VYKSKGLRRHIAALPSGILRVLAVLAIERNIGEKRVFRREIRFSAVYYCTSNRPKEKFILLGIAKNSRSEAQMKQEIPVLTVAR